MDKLVPQTLRNTIRNEWWYGEIAFNDSETFWEEKCMIQKVLLQFYRFSGFGVGN